MGSAEQWRERFEASQARFDDLLATIGDAPLPQSLPGLRSNSIGEQIWCVIGARQSYRRAVEAGEWNGFSCSVTGEEIGSSASLREALRTSAEEWLATAPLWTDEARASFVFDLLEHEATHQGQLIRYLYGCGLEIPKSWQKRFALQP